MICNALVITCSISYVDEAGKQHCHKQYGLSDLSRKILIDVTLLFEHYIPNIIILKNVNIMTNRTLKLSPLISVMIQKKLTLRLPMKYSNIAFNITDFNCKVIIFDKQYGIMKNHHVLINSISTG